MYEKFFGFRERPFDLTPNPRFLVLTDSHREALSNLEYGIASGKGVTLLVGEAGSGKTTVIRTAVDRQPAAVHCVYLNNPTLTRNEFIEMLAAQFALSDRAAASKAVLLMELEQQLRERRARGESTVLVVDEAQSLPFDLLEEIRLLANMETSSDKLISLILAGQPELADRLNEQALRQLKQRVALRCELRPLTLSETAAYLAGRIRAAGGVGAQVFTREAVTLMHARSKGIPRTISVIADNALLSGFALGQRPVGFHVVREVCRDFHLDDEGGEVAARPAEAARAAETASAANPVPAPKADPLSTAQDSSTGDTNDAGDVVAVAQPPEAPVATVVPFGSAGSAASAGVDGLPGARRDETPEGEGTSDETGEPAPAAVPRTLFSAIVGNRRRFTFFRQ